MVAYKYLPPLRDTGECASQPWYIPTIPEQQGEHPCGVFSFVYSLMMLKPFKHSCISHLGNCLGLQWLKVHKPLTLFCAKPPKWFLSPVWAHPWNTNSCWFDYPVIQLILQPLVQHRCDAGSQPDLMVAFREHLCSATVPAFPSAWASLTHRLNTVARATIY